MQGRKTTASRGSKSRGKDAAPDIDAGLLWRRLAWIAAAAVWLFALASLASYSPADAPAIAVAPVNDIPANWGGRFGAWLSHWMFFLLGAGAWALLLALGAELLLIARGKHRGQPGVRALGALCIALAFAGFHALLAPAWSSLPQGSGGVLAIAGVAELSARFGTLGAALWITLLGAIGLVVAFDHLVLIAPAAAARWTASALADVGASARDRALALFEERREAAAERAALREARKAERRAEIEARKEAAKQRLAERENDVDDDESIPETRTVADRALSGARVELKSKPAPVAAHEIDEEDEDAEEIEDAPGAPQVFAADELREKMAKLPVRFAAANKQQATEEDLLNLQAEGEEIEGYRFPSLDILEDPDENYSAEMEAFVREQAQALEEALRVYRIDGEVVGIDSGPVITLYEVRLAPGTKVAAIEAISKDVARALKVVNIRIVPNLEGRDTIGIEAPNLKKERVRLKELMTGSEKASKMRLPLFLGKDASGEPLIEDLASLPHMLIAGTTGSGKSVCMNAIIMGFLYTKKPSELKLVLVDPKMVEMSQFRDIPHLMCPVVTEMGKAAAILEWAVNKMDERYELLAEAGVRDIDAYNELEREDLFERLGATTEMEQARIPKRLPRMVFIIDELADLMMTNKEVEGSIVRIAQKARAVGIHLILATQRPQANVVTGLIKSNMPGRLAFKVASAMDSRIVLDQKGAELLLGQGDMLFLSPRSHKLVRSQGTLVDDIETRRVVKFMKTVAGPSFERQLVQIRSAADEEADRDWRETAEKDPLFDKAVEIILETKRGSVSLLQRRLAIGYTRASRLIDLMGAAGIIGEHKGSVAREVVISREEWEAMKAQAEQDAANETLWGSDPAATSATATAPEPAPFDAHDEGEEEHEEYEEEDDDEGEWEEDEAETDEDAEEEADEDEYEELDDGEEEEDEEYEDEEGDDDDEEWEESDDEDEGEEDDEDEEWDEEDDDAEEEDDEAAEIEVTPVAKGARRLPRSA